MDRPGVINSAGGQMDIYGFACDRGFLQPSNCFARIEEVFEGSLACMIVRKCIFDKIGGFDEQMFIVDEDTDFCWRCWLAGYKVIFFPKALVYHKGSFSIGVFNPNRRFLSVRNTLRMIIKNAGIRLLIVMTGRFLVIKSLQIFYFIVKREHDMAMAILKALYWNLVNLRDTLIERRRVQKLRKTHDKYIHTKLTPYSLEIQIFKQRIYERINNTGWSNGRRVR
jgi:GT2 family glycosyltransferase